MAVSVFQLINTQFGKTCFCNSPNTKQQPQQDKQTFLQLELSLTHFYKLSNAARQKKTTTNNLIQHLKKRAIAMDPNAMYITTVVLTYWFVSISMVYLNKVSSNKKQPIQINRAQFEHLFKMHLFVNGRKIVFGSKF